LELRSARDGLLRGEGLRALAHRLVPGRAGDEPIDEAPVLGALALEALGERAEHVRAVSTNLALVDEAREAAGARQHREQRRLGERHGAVAVVDEQDLVARERELVTAAGGGALAR